MAKITGADKHLKRLRGMRNVAKQVVTALYDAGMDIQDDAQASIMAGSVSGKGHVPSAPGTPPNNDMGDLHDSIVTTVQTQSPPTIHVTAGGPKAPYAVVHEFGGSKHPERPFMRPATEKNRKKVGQKVAAAVKIAVRKG